MRTARFWVAAAIFQAAFGLAVFAITRHYYSAPPDELSPEATDLLQSLPSWPDRITGTTPAAPGPSAPVPAGSSDPATIARNADESFGSGQYEQAAELYRQLLTLNPKDVENYNNLGLTLHYTGRSAEALQVLGQGTALEPAHQRIWLTTGFVNAELGNLEQARAALGKAQVGANAEIREAAVRMLAGLPPQKRAASSN